MKPTRAYIATSLDNQHMYLPLRDALEQRGITVTFDWTRAPALTRDALTPSHRQRACEDLDGVVTAHFLVFAAPGGNGSHVELGAALALGKPVLMWGRQPPGPYVNVFHAHPLVVPYESRDPFPAALDDFLARYALMRS